MAEDNPNKIHFRFYVINDTHIPELPAIQGRHFRYDPDTMPHLGSLRVANGLLPAIDGNSRGYHPNDPYPVFDTPEPGYPLQDIVAQPDGLVFIPASMFANLKYEDQLAAMLSFAITAIIQKHAYQFNRAAYVGSYGPGSGVLGCSDYGCSLLFYVPPWKYGEATQCLRMAIHDLLTRNSRIDDVPDVWSIARAQSDPNPIDASNSDPNQIAPLHAPGPWYQAYTFTFLNQYYPALAAGFPNENGIR